MIPPMFGTSIAPLSVEGGTHALSYLPVRNTNGPRFYTKPNRRRRTMKRLLLVLIIMSLPHYALAADMEVTLEWDANTEEDLAGYRLYDSTESGVYGTIPKAAIPAGTETVTVTVPDGLVYFVLTAFDEAGNESGYSNEVMSRGVPPEAPTRLQLIRVALAKLFKKIFAWLQYAKLRG